MAKRVFQAATWTPTATADNSTLANGTYMAIGAGSSTQMLNVLEIYQGGQATASAVNIMQFARDLVLASTPTALTTPNGDGPMNGATAALSAPVVTCVAATTGPSRTNTGATARLNLSFNAFGGVVRWVAAPGEEWTIIGTSVSISESSLSAFTGGNVGLMGAHIIYEPF
jgi:hypothetical protein